MATGSTAGLVLSLVGACSIRKKQFNIYFGLSGLAAVVLTAVVVSIVFSFLVRSDIKDQLNKVNVRSELGRAARSEAVMGLWDSLQERYQCCGAIGTSGYQVGGSLALSLTLILMTRTGSLTSMAHTQTLAVSPSTQTVGKMLTGLSRRTSARPSTPGYR